MSSKYEHYTVDVSCPICGDCCGPTYAIHRYRGDAWMPATAEAEYDRPCANCGASDFTPAQDAAMARLALEEDTPSKDDFALEHDD